MQDHQAAIDAAFKVLRESADNSGYGNFIKDEALMKTAEDVVAAIEALDEEQNNG